MPRSVHSTCLININLMKEVLRYHAPMSFLSIALFSFCSFSDFSLGEKLAFNWANVGDSGGEGSAFPYLMGKFGTCNPGFIKTKQIPNKNLSSFFHTLDLESSHRTYPISVSNLITLRGNCSEGKKRSWLFRLGQLLWSKHMTDITLLRRVEMRIKVEFESF